MLIGEKDRRNYVLIKEVNKFMYDRTLHRGRIHIFCLCLQAFSAEEV